MQSKSCHEIKVLICELQYLLPKESEKKSLTNFRSRLIFLLLIAFQLILLLLGGWKRVNFVLLSLAFFIIIYVPVPLFSVLYFNLL